MLFEFSIFFWTTSGNERISALCEDGNLRRMYTCSNNNIAKASRKVEEPIKKLLVQFSINKNKSNKTPRYYILLKFLMTMEM